MSEKIPRLRADLDFMPSPLADRPGLLIRDPHEYSETTLVIPPPLLECLRVFDGNSTPLDLRQILVRVTGELDVSQLLEHLVGSFRDAGFLEDDVYERLREGKMRAFAEAATREASHAGSAYPAEPEPLRLMLNRYLDGTPPSPRSGDVMGIAAPHVSLEGGSAVYRAAYQTLPPEERDRVFVILGTSHYGAPDRFGLTRKNFVTPLGEAVTDVSLVNRLAARAPNSVEMEDYCHASEHSIEFQVVFLQHLCGPHVRILPILCGSFARSIYEGGPPEDNDEVRRFFGELGDLAADQAGRLFWVLGVDMAHMGRRYGDSFDARANRDAMITVAERDRGRIQHISNGDPEGFWQLVQQDRDDLKWCGSSSFYTFLRANPKARARLLDYQQWNIDEQSVVSFGALAFHLNS